MTLKSFLWFTTKPQPDYLIRYNPLANWQKNMERFSNQRKLLKAYINNVSNTNSLKEFVESETVKVKSKLQSFLPKVDDKVTKIKLNEAINQADTLVKGRIVEDKQVVTLMRYYQLVKELKNVKNG